jgi:hypothetical protein
LSGVTAEWPRRAADTVDLVVDTIHDRALRPIFLVARAVVFGLLIATVGVALIVLLSVALVRLLDVYVFPGKVWASYLLVGGVFTLAGLTAWIFGSRRQAGDAVGR